MGVTVPWSPFFRDRFEGEPLKRIALTDPKRAWLRAHLDAPDCTATEAALAEAAGQPIGDYHALAAEFAVALDVDLPSPPIALLAGGHRRALVVAQRFAAAAAIHRGARR